MGSDAPIETQGRDDLRPVGVDRSGSLARTLATAIEATRTEIDTDLRESDILAVHRQDQTAKRVENFTISLG